MDEKASSNYTPVEKQEATYPPEDYFGADESQREVAYRSDGERRFYEISGFSREHRISPQLEVLFSLLSDEPDHTGFNVPKHSNATFTSLGFEYDGTRYPYNSEQRDHIHLAVIRNIVKDAHSREEAIKEFNKANDSWQENLTELTRKRILKTLTKEYNLKKDLLEKKQEELKSIDLGYRLEKATQAERDEQSAKIHSEIVESGFMTEKELAEFDNFEEEKNKLIDFFQNTLVEHHFNNIITGATNGDERLPDGEKNEFKDIAEAFGQKQATRLSGFINATGKRTKRNLEYFPDNSEFERPKLIAEQIRKSISRYQNSNSKETPEHYQTQIIKSIDDEYGDSPEKNEILQSIQDFFQKTDNYYNKLFPKYREFANRTEFVHYEEINDIKAQIKELTRDHRANDPEKAIAESVAKVAELKNTTAKIAFQKTEKPEEVFFYTTGVVALYDGSPYLSSISPLDERIMKQFEDPAESLFWTKNWTKHVSDHDKIVRELIGTKIQGIKEDPQNEFEKRKHLVTDKYSIIEPRIFNPENGEIYDSLQTEDLDLLEDILPYIGDFIHGIIIDYGDKDISLKSTRLEIVNYLAGRRALNSTQLYDDNFNLKIRTAEHLYYNAGPAKSEKALNRLIGETAIVLYKNLSYRQREDFNQIIGPYAEISPAEFYRVFRHQIADSKERRQIVLRSFFVKGFLEYANGETDPAIANFIESLKKHRTLA